MILDPYFTLYTKMNTISISDLNIKTKLIKLLEEKRTVILPSLGFANGFLDVNTKAWATEVTKK